MQLTDRCEKITVMTVSALRSRLEQLSNAGCSFAVHKVRNDHVSVRADYRHEGNKKRSFVILPAYPTGWPDDATCSNVNVVLEPLRFDAADDACEREMFAPLLGHDVLHYYETLHPDNGVAVTRCC